MSHCTVSHVLAQWLIESFYQATHIHSMVTTGQSVDADPSHPCRPWRFFDELLGRGRPPPPNIDAMDIHCCLEDKVAGVCATSACADPLFSLTAQPVVHSFHVFSLTTPADVTLIIHSLPITSSACRIHCRLDC